MSTERDTCAESSSWFSGEWKFTDSRHLVNSFVGPFIVFIILESLTQFTIFTWDNGSWGAAVIILFSLPTTSASIPRHIILGQILSALVAFACAFMISSQHLHFLRTTLSVSLSALFMKLLGISNPPGGATAYILSQQDIVSWSIRTLFWYLLFPLFIGSIVLILCALVLNNVLIEKYPKIWV